MIARLRRGLVLLALVIVPALVPALAEAADAEAAELRPEADAELLSRIVEEEGIATARSVTRLEWLRHLARTLWERLRERIADAGPVVGFAARVLLWVFVIGLPPLVGYLLWRRLGGRAAARTRTEIPERVEEIEELPPEVDLRAALDAELAAGRPRAALRCAWIWLARRLAARGLGRFDLEVTNREFVSSVRRKEPDWSGHAELARLAALSERFLYAGHPCGTEDVRAFVRDAEELSS